MMARLELGFPTDRLLELEQRLDVVGVSHTMVPSERRRARDLTATVFTMQCARGPWPDSRSGGAARPQKGLIATEVDDGRESRGGMDASILRSAAIGQPLRPDDKAKRLDRALGTGC